MFINEHTRVRNGTKEGFKYVAFSTPKDSGFEVTAIMYCKNGAIENMVSRYHICGGHITSHAAAIKETVREL